MAKGRFEAEGTRIVSARLALGSRRGRLVSQSELGDLVGVGQKTVASWEQGRKRPSLDTYRKLAKVFGCDVGLLLGDATPEGTPEKEAVTEPVKVEAPKRANRPISGKTGVHPPTPDAEAEERKA